MSWGLHPCPRAPPTHCDAGLLLRLQNFGEHGRELITSEIALRLIRLLCDPGRDHLPPLLASLGLPEDHLRAVLNRTVLRVGGGWALGLRRWCDESWVGGAS